MATCHEPGNGGAQCIKEEDFSALYDAARSVTRRQDTFDEAVGRLVAESSATRKDTRETRRLVESVLVPEVQRLSLLVGTAVPPAGMYGAVIRLANERLVDTSPKVPTIKQSIYDDEGEEITKVNRSYLLGLKALQEKARTERWRIVAGIVGGVVTSGALGALLTRLLGG